VLDTTKLNAALDSDPTSVQNLLGGNGNGFSQAFSNALNPYVQTGGVFSSRIDAANSEIKDFTESIADMDDRLQRKQDQLRQMFTSMELALQKTKSQGAELLAKLGVSSNDS
jgi:flagellar capping protein FliD